MASLYTSVSLLNFKQYDFLHSAPINCIKLTEKYHCPHGDYASARSEYFQSNCSKCKHQWKVKRNMKTLDKLFRNHKCLFMSWDCSQPLILFFSDGSVVSLEFNSANNTLLNVEIDDNLCRKIIQSRIVDAVLYENCIYLTYIEPKLTIIHISQDSPTLFSKIFGRKKGKLVGSEPKIINIDLFVQSSKNLKRKLSLNVKRDLLLIWWKNSNTVRPWTPVTHLIKRANILIYSLDDLNIEFVCSMSAQDDLLYAIFSKQNCNGFFTLEEGKIEKEAIVNICFYEIIHGECQLTCTEKLPVRGNIIAFDWSSDDKLLAADSAGQLLIHDIKKRWNIVTNLEFLPKCLAWHPQSCLALIVCRNKNLMAFDSALNSVGFQLWSETLSDPKYLILSSYLHHQFFNQYFIQKIIWQKSAFNDTCLLFLDPELSSFILLKFSFGRITRHKISVLELVSQRLKCNEVDLAILLMKSLEWKHNNQIKFQCLSKIAQYLLRKPLDFYTLSWLQMTIGAYFEWMDIIPKRVIEMYEDKMHRLGRRFFHHLLRYHQLRKAYLLAIDLDCQDLFFDLYYVANQCNENELAFAAFQKASEDDCQLKDSSSCSTCESSASDTNSELTSDSNIVSYSDNFPQTVPKTMMAQYPPLDGLKNSHTLADITDIPPCYKNSNTLADITDIPPCYKNYHTLADITDIPPCYKDNCCTEPNRFKSRIELPSSFVYSLENAACQKKDSYNSDFLLNRTVINDNYTTIESATFTESPTIDEVNEEIGSPNFLAVSTHTLADITDIPPCYKDNCCIEPNRFKSRIELPSLHPHYKDNTLGVIQRRFKSKSKFPSSLLYSTVNAAFSMNRDSYISDHLSGSAEINDNCSTLESSMVNENSILVDVGNMKVEDSKSLVDIAGIHPHYKENALAVIQHESKSKFALPSTVVYTAENIPCSIVENASVSDHLSNTIEINDNCNSLELGKIKENPAVDEDNEELEGTKIKLAHLGII